MPRYKHGPLARMVIGDQQVQGLDYAYTIQGWLKGVNGTSLQSNFDMGRDGDTTWIDRYTAKDAFAFSLNYFTGDYTAISSSAIPFPATSAYLASSYKPLYNGNFSSMAVNIGQFSNPMLYAYTYDQLNRLTGMDAFNGLNQTTNSWSSLTSLNDYKERIVYDANGYNQPSPLNKIFSDLCLMREKSIKIQVSAAIGKVSGKRLVPAAAQSVLVLAHGAGAGMEHSFMETLASRLAEREMATVRFNFPFAENKKGRADSPAIAHQAVKAAIAKTRALFPGIPLFVAGKSFGGRMSSQYLSASHDASVSGIVFYGFPLHPAGKPSTERAEHLKQVKLPMLFLQGTKDALADWDLVEAVCKSIRLATLIKLEGADHSFKAGKKDTISWLADATKQWTEKIIAGKNK